MNRLSCAPLVLVLTSGCAGKSDPPATRPVSSASAAAVDAGPPVISFDDLASRGAIAAPLMHEVARVTGATKLEAKTADTCFRAAVATRGSIVGRPETAGDTWVPPSGPICLRKGQSTMLSVEGRAVVFASP